MALMHMTLRTFGLCDARLRGSGTPETFVWETLDSSWKSDIWKLNTSVTSERKLKLLPSSAKRRRGRANADPAHDLLAQVRSPSEVSWPAGHS